MSGMNCVIVGGCANGVILPNLRPDAQWIELKRPEYIKPLASSLQNAPDIVHETDKYEIHVIALTNTETERSALFAIGVVEGKSLTWAFSELCKSHVEHITAQLIKAGHIQTN